MLLEPWTIGMLGGLRVQRADRTISRFSTQKTAGLLARLAYFPNQNHAREELIEMLWPDSPTGEAGRQSLRQALSSIRRLLEPAGTAQGSIVAADRSFIRLQPKSFETDVCKFEALLEKATGIADEEERFKTRLEAVELYNGPLLPGFYDSWIPVEKEWLSSRLLSAISGCIDYYEARGAVESAIALAIRQVGVDPLVEDGYTSAIRLYLSAGRHAAGWRLYQQAEKEFSAQLDAAPSDHLKSLAERCRAGLAAGGAIGDISDRPPRPEGGPDTAPAPKPRRGGRSAAKPTPQERPIFEGLTFRRPVLMGTCFGRDPLLRILNDWMQPMPENGGEGGHNIRLATLTGPSGCGKTRLAAEVAHRLAPRFAGAVAFVPLAALTDPSLISSAILEALGVSRVASHDPLSQTADLLSRGPCLLVLDNFEQLVRGDGDHVDGVEVVRRLMETSPRLSLIVTSQRVLNLRGERELIVPTLETPFLCRSLEDALTYPSVEFFVDRAQEKSARFAMTTRNWEAIATLCSRLDGLPLALELAAAQVDVLTPAQMLDQLERRFEFLVVKTRGITPRQQSLQLSLEWSYRLLAQELQQFFAAISVFRGGWTGDAPSIVCAEPFADEYLRQLRAHSLVTTDEVDGRIRFQQLASVREFAWMLLTAEQRVQLQQRHADYYRALAEDAEKHYFGMDPDPWYRRLDAEHDNLRAALDWYATSKQPLPALCLGGSMAWYWYIRGHQYEGRRRLEQAIDMPVDDLDVLTGHCDAVTQGKAFNGLGTLAFSQGDYSAARAAHEASLRIFEELGDEKSMGIVLNDIALSAFHQSDFAHARVNAERARELLKNTTDHHGIVTALNLLGLVAAYTGADDDAATYLREALTTSRKLGDPTGIACALDGVAEGFIRQGFLSRAKTAIVEALELHDMLQSIPGVASSQADLALVLCFLGMPSDGLAAAEPAAETAHRIGERWIEIKALYALGWIWHYCDDAETSTRCFARTLMLAHSLMAPAVVADSLDAVAVAAVSIDPQHRAQFWGAADHLRIEIGSPRSLITREHCLKGQQALRDSMGDSAFDKEYRHGAEINIERIIDLVSHFTML